MDLQNKKEQKVDTFAQFKQGSAQSQQPPPPPNPSPFNFPPLIPQPNFESPPQVQQQAPPKPAPQPAPQAVPRPAAPAPPKKNQPVGRYAISIVVAIVVILAAYYVYSYFVMPVYHISPISLATNSFAVSQGQSTKFTVYNTEPGAVISFYPGDGQVINATANSNTLQITYSYQTAGKFLSYVSEYKGGKLLYSSLLLPIQVTPVVNSSISQYVSEPVLSFNASSAPVFNLSSYAYVYMGFLQPPLNANFTITKYILTFSNGTSESFNANSSTFEPSVNPIKLSLPSAGVYPLKITVITTNSVTQQEYNTTYMQDIVVNSPSSVLSVFKYNGAVPNPGVITVAENVQGGAYSFDPQVDYETVGFEVIANTIGTLLEYNGSSSTSFIPYIASQVPSVSNGGITNNYTDYTFQIRNGLHFSNGDSLTAYDVWYSVIRSLLFIGGQPVTPDWILAEYIVPNATEGVPIITASNENQAFSSIMNSVTYNNQTNTVTFHLVKPTTPALLYQALADPLGAGILDAKWLNSVGAGITFTPSGFLQYTSYANEGNYNLQVQYDPVASGPYEIKTYIPGQSVVLAPNPYFTGIPSIPAVNNTVVIDWVKDPQTTYDLFASDQADIVSGLPPSYFPALKSMEAQGTTEIYQFPTLSNFFFAFNLNVSETSLKQLGSQYSIPSDYFANLDVRKAFDYAFNYTEYINNILGNQKYGFNFGSNYPDAIIDGLPYYTPASGLANVSYFNISYAKQLLLASGEYNVSVNFPIVVSSGDTTDFYGAQMWAQALHQMDPNINIVVTYEPFSTIVGYMVPGQNPFPIYQLGWSADFPYPSDFVNSIYLQDGAYPAPDGWSVQYLDSLNYTNEASVYNELNNMISAADSATSSAVAAQDYKGVEQLAVNLYMYTYTLQPNEFWVIKSYITPYDNQISYQENPMIGGGADGLYFWWNKA